MRRSTKHIADTTTGKLTGPVSTAKHNQTIADMYCVHQCVLGLYVCDNRDGRLVAWGLWVHVESFLHSVASPFHSFVTTVLISACSRAQPNAPAVERYRQRYQSAIGNAARALSAMLPERYRQRYPIAWHSTTHMTDGDHN